ncbi:receptor-like protein 42 [Apium graveolens]|uniref:receptor-like protein 42 n=1 Tax=Apium graveolens TaxID=4045 RepID=UPI003D7B9BBE
MNWSMSSDYCIWQGVTCDHKTGDVIGLDLSCSGLEGAILPNSTLFQLSNLRFLNLSQNDFSLSNQFPQEFGFFAKGLTHLSLSSTWFSGRVPSGISHLYELVSLDLSDNYFVQLEDKVFRSLLQNLTQLRVLNLVGVNISSVLPMNLSSSLEVLNLGHTGLYGVPMMMLTSPLFYLWNTGLHGVFPKVKWGSSATLQHLSLFGIDFRNGGMPDSIGYLESLVSLDLSNCNLSGPTPRSIGNLVQLTDLSLEKNNLNGLILTLLANSTEIRYLYLDSNNFTGPLPSTFVAHSRNLISLGLSSNGFTGPLPSLENLGLSDKGFRGQLHEFDSSESILLWFSCKNNALHGTIPQSFSQLVELTDLDFSSNNFSGVLNMSMFSRLESLEYLDLSHNHFLSVRSTGMIALPPKLTHLYLSSCNMKKFPHFSKDAEISLGYVDLSNNDIEGEIPDWIESVGWYLNISHNKLTGGLKQLPWNTIQYLDLQSNYLNGSLPDLICNSSSLEILNLSHNKLSGVLPSCGTQLTLLSVFDLRMNNIQGSLPSTLSNFRNLKSLNLHGNKLQGGFPSSFSEFDKLETLDLGSNQINDTFPQCLEALPNLQVLVPKSNKFYGTMNKTSEVEQPFPSLRIIDLSYNDFSGPLPVIYFRNFKAMMNGDISQSFSQSSHRPHTTFYCKFDSESLDLSSNQLEGEIPGQLTGLYSLALLNLSYNKLRGHIPEGFQFNTFEIDSYVGNLGLWKTIVQKVRT